LNASGPASGNTRSVEGVEDQHRQPEGLVHVAIVGRVLDEDALLVAESRGEHQVVVPVAVHVEQRGVLAVDLEAGREVLAGRVGEGRHARDDAGVQDQRGRLRRGVAVQVARELVARRVEEQHVEQAVVVRVERQRGLAPQDRTGDLQRLLHELHLRAGAGGREGDEQQDGDEGGADDGHGRGSGAGGARRVGEGRAGLVNR
jgi:hypothetical protein